MLRRNFAGMLVAGMAVEGAPVSAVTTNARSSHAKFIAEARLGTPVRDGAASGLKEAPVMGFHYFARQGVVSHAHVHEVDFGTAVQMGWVTLDRAIRPATAGMEPKQRPRTPPRRSPKRPPGSPREITA